MLQRHLIVNVGVAKQFGDTTAWAQHLHVHTSELTTNICASALAASTATREALRRGAEQIIAVGGDGTVNAVLQGFFENGASINPLATLAVAGGGTGNDYLRLLQKCSTSKDYRQGLVDNRAQLTDLGKVETALPNGQTTTRYFTNMASAGLSAQIVEQKALQRRIPKLLRYAVATASALRQRNPSLVRFVADEVSNQIERCEVLFIAKGQYMGGGMNNGTGASLADGYLSYLALDNLTFKTILRHLPKVFTGQLAEISGAIFGKARRLDVTAADTFLLEVDGDIVGCGNFSAEVMPLAIRVCR